MIEHVVFRCQLLSVFAECRPCCPDTILDFRRFLVVERDFLTLIFHAFISCQYFDFHVFNFKFLFCVRVAGALVTENLRLVWMDPETHFFSYFLEFTQHFPQLFFGSCEQHYVVGKSQVREAVSFLVAQVNSHSFFLLPSLNFVLQ